MSWHGREMTYLRLIQAVLVLALSFGFDLSAADFLDRSLPFAGSFRTSYAQGLGPDSARGALVFDPSLRFPVDVERKIEVATSVERPTDPYLNFAIPRTTMSFSQQLSAGNRVATSAHYVANLLHLDRWREGHMIRQSVLGEVNYEPFSRLTLTFRAGPFHQWNRYRQSPFGEDLPRHGIQEQFRVAWRPGRFGLYFRLTINQSYRGVWVNEYSTQQLLSFELFDGVAVGVGHELTTGAIDETTGFNRRVRMFDDRESRLNTFVELSL